MLFPNHVSLNMWDDTEERLGEYTDPELVPLKPC